MFGYVTVNEQELKVKEDSRYHAYYCGLCHALHERSGRAGQATLTYDMTFLVILLNGLYEDPMEEKHTGCILHPLKKYDKRFNRWSDYAADMNVLLAYYNLLDDWKDDRKLSRAAAAKLLSGACRKIEDKYPRQGEAVKKYIRELTACENSGSQDIEAAAVLTGQMLAEVFVPAEDMWAADLRTIGFFLGKFIYFMDAYEDIEKDIKNGSYNPFKLIYEQSGFDENIKQILMMQMAECCKAFERLPIIEEVGILRNILYSGVWTKFAMVYNKRIEDTGENE